MNVVGFVIIMVLGGVNVYFLSLALPDKMDACYFSAPDKLFSCFGELNGFITATTYFFPLILLIFLALFGSKMEGVYIYLAGVIGVVLNIVVLVNHVYL